MLIRILFLLLLPLGSLVAQKSATVSPLRNVSVLETQRRELHEEVARDWKAFEESLVESRLTPEEKIRRINVWHATRAAKHEELSVVTRGLAREMAKTSQSRSITPIHSTDPALASIEQKDAAIANAMNAARASGCTAEEMIQKVDEALASNQALIEARDHERAALVRQSTATGNKSVVQTPEEHIAEVDLALVTPPEVQEFTPQIQP